MNSKQNALDRNFPFYVAIVGVALTLIVFVFLMNEAPWHPVWNTTMALSILLGAVGAWLIKAARQWGALATVVSGLGVFFSFLLAYADNIQVLGYQYPLVLFAMAPLCVSGIWVAVERIDLDDEGNDSSETQPPPSKPNKKSKRK